MAEAVVPTASSPSVPVPTTLPVRAILPWAVFVGLLALFAVYFVGAEQGATSIFAGTGVHEWVHDGRHLLGFPCH
ncbi:CbtB-domain containing protein [Yinghuangia sp. ASG 101]|uniref:CbtB domain-containing protein n=1 Tax=Yinghuangia sp. ASG 101 TaxID=2896848 RepID=UPI001E39C839|nr:CbtB domain-containing protein [Yinghuangia sp. ASG 101]UGQ11705.1 CbtB-domain containing protein [Yinghuangia sp. ASG 101]